MDVERRSRTFCFIFDIKTGTVIILGTELVFAILGLISAITKRIESGDNEELKFAEDTDTLICSVVIQVCNIIGLFGIKKRNPNLLLPTLICRIPTALGVLVLFFVIVAVMITEDWHEVAPILFFGFAFFLLFVVYSAWAVYSTAIVYLCYKEMKEDLIVNGQSSAATPYNHLVNPPV